MDSRRTTNISAVKPVEVVCMSLKKKTKDCGTLSPKLMIYLFDSLVRPVLTYGCAVWDTRSNGGVGWGGGGGWGWVGGWVGVGVGGGWGGGVQVDKIHLWYLRALLGIKATSSNVITLGECGSIPPSVTIQANCIDVLAPLIMEIVNLSLSTGKMPDDYKNAVLIPLLKKISLDQEIFNNFRPISNLVYISKLIEKVIASRLHSHMTNNNLYEELQSSNRKFHSTETALTCVHDDILKTIDDNKSVLLIMLDLSAAFDTVDHDVLLERLKSGLGICGTALNWFKSYLSGRSQSVLINGTQSKPTSLVCGVPQGSVLGPILFTIYMLPLGDIIKRHGMQFHMYADDCQLYTTFEASDINQTALNMEILIDDIRGWYSENMLKLNDSKTEMMVISSKFRPSVHLDHIKIGESSISPSETVWNLGVIMDSNYTMVSHINHKVQESFLKIRELSYYLRYLTDESSKTAVHAYVTSRLDYCNSLLYGLPKELSKKLQSVMNTAARLVTRTRKFDHITPVLQDLHWLPIESRSKFKILLLVYKCLYGLAPSYLSKRLSLKPNRGLRSDDKLVLNVPTTKLKTKTWWSLFLNCLA